MRGVVEHEGVPRFCKRNRCALPGHFAAEAAGLQALRDAKCGLFVPRPIAHSDDENDSFLIVELVEETPRTATFWEQLGRGLAQLHKATDARGFGFPLDGYCGPTPQPNGWLDAWPQFYGERRLGHQLALATGLSASTRRTVEKVIARLPELVSSGGPSLIHGDLWSGNVMSTTTGPVLVDPAAYYAHREAELGMMTLFGGFPARVFDAYDEAWPLVPGWRDRLDLYALYHLLNHYNLFGGAYEDEAVRVARRYA